MYLARVEARLDPHSAFLNADAVRMSSATLDPWRAEFPGLEIDVVDDPLVSPASTALVLDARAWLDPRTDPSSIDGPLRNVLSTGTGTGVLVMTHVPPAPAARAAKVVGQVLTRAQRFVVGPGTVATSTPAGFDAVLERFRALHADDGRRGLREAYDHGIDTLRWLLRLDRHASFAARLATLYYDAAMRNVVPVTDEQDRTVGHVSARILSRAVEGLAIDPAVLARAERIVSRTALSDGVENDDAVCVRDAAALSFLSLDAAHFLDVCGPARTRHRICSHLRAMGPAASAHVADIRCRADLHTLLLVAQHEVASGAPRGTSR